MAKGGPLDQPSSLHLAQGRQRQGPKKISNQGRATTNNKLKEPQLEELQHHSINHHRPASRTRNKQQGSQREPTQGCSLQGVRNKEVQDDREGEPALKKAGIPVNRGEHVRQALELMEKEAERRLAADKEKCL